MPFFAPQFFLLSLLGIQHKEIEIDENKLYKEIEENKHHGRVDTFITKTERSKKWAIE